MDGFLTEYLSELGAALTALPTEQILKMALTLVELREKGGRLFVIGVGGSAGNASHACADFRNLCGIETYCPTDNSAALTAQINDEGWEGAFSSWLVISKVGPADAILVLSVGGGDLARGVSTILVSAIERARANGAQTLAILGRSDGYAAKACDQSLIAGSTDARLITPVAETLQSAILHALVFHPILQLKSGTWEGLLGV